MSGRGTGHGISKAAWGGPAVHLQCLCVLKAKSGTPLATWDILCPVLLPPPKLHMLKVENSHIAVSIHKSSESLEMDLHLSLMKTMRYIPLLRKLLLAIAG